MSDNETDKYIANFRESASRFKEKHGSVEALVGPSNPLALLGITSLDGVPIVVEHGVKMVDTSGSKPDIEVDGPLIYFHKDDHSMFGSKAQADDDWDINDDGWGDDD